MTDYYTPEDPGFAAQSLSYRSTHNLGSHTVYINKETKTAIIVVTKSRKGTDYATAAGIVGWFDRLRERGVTLYADFAADGRLVRRVDLAKVVDVARQLKPEKSIRDGMPDFYWLNADDFGDGDVEF